jgi:hypothetical protein
MAFLMPLDPRTRFVIVGYIFAGSFRFDISVWEDICTTSQATFLKNSTIFGQLKSTSSLQKYQSKNILYNELATV